MQQNIVKVIITLQVFFLVNCLVAQKPSLDFFKDYHPKWIHAVFDTTALDSVGYDDYSRTFHRSSLLHEGNLIVLYEYLLNYYNGDGGYLVSVDMESGEENWASFFDLRIIEKNEEPDGLRIDEDGFVEVYGRRYFNKVTSIFQGHGGTTLVLRKYDSENGDLLEWSFPNPLDSTTAQLSNLEWPLVFYIGNDLYQSVRPKGFDYTKFTSVICDKDGKFMRTDSLDFPDAYYATRNVGQIQLVNHDTFITSLYFREATVPKDMPFDFKFHVLVYDRMLNEIKSLDQTKDFLRARNQCDFQIAYADDDHFVVMFFNEPVLFKQWTKDYYFYDYDGNIVDSVEIFWDNNIGISKILRLSSDEFLLVGVNSKSNTTVFDLHFYKKKLNGPLTLLKVLPMKIIDHAVIANDLYLLDNNDVLLVGDYYKLDREYQPVLLRRFPLMIRFDGSDLGLVGTNDPGQVVQVLEVFPNPVRQTLTIQASRSSDRIFITDMLGRRQEVKATQSDDTHQIDVSGLIPGCYQLSVLNDQGYLTGTARFIKVE